MSIKSLLPAAAAVAVAALALTGCTQNNAAPAESSDPAVSVEVSWARQVWSNIVSGEVQEAGSAKASSPAREAAVTGAVDAARRATAWGADFSSLPGYAA